MARTFNCSTFRAQQLRPLRASRMVCHAAVVESDGTSIRRRPPRGIDSQPCGPIAFTVDTDGETDGDNAPRNILEEIVWFKAQEIEKWRLLTPAAQIAVRALQGASSATFTALHKLYGRVLFEWLIPGAPKARDFRGAILEKLEATGKPGLIAEVKKASPSKGVIQPNFDPVEIASGYERGGAACLSVLTDRKFFQGSFENITAIRQAGIACPILCKEFIVDAYQIMKARAAGADAVLLIAAVLPNVDLAYFTKAATRLGMVCLIEVHSIEELTRVLEVPDIDKHILGINNRDLGTFEVDLMLTKTIMESPAGQQAIERGIPMVGESGIFTPEHVKVVQDAGCQAILVGESIVKQGNTEQAVKDLLA